MTSTPALTIQDGICGFVVYTDASRRGLSCVIMQQGKVVVYVSGQQKDHEKNYPTYELEIAMMFSLKMQKLFTDHQWKFYLSNSTAKNLCCDTVEFCYSLLLDALVIWYLVPNRIISLFRLTKTTFTKLIWKYSSPCEKWLLQYSSPCCLF